MNFCPGRCLICAVIVFTVGCGSGIKPIENAVPCSGVVTFDGKPLEQGSVTFAPVDEKIGRSASGQVNNGNFNMLTSASAPGVVIGKYKVSVTSTEAPKPLSPEQLAKPPANLPGPYPPPSPSLIPKKYTSPTTSGLEVEVTKGMPPVMLELKK